MNKIIVIELFGGPSDGSKFEMNEENMGLDVQTVAPGYEGKDPKDWKYCTYVRKDGYRYEYQGQK